MLTKSHPVPKLFAETIRDILPEFRRNWTNPVEPSSVATLFGATPKEVPPHPSSVTPGLPADAAQKTASAGRATPPTDAAQSSVSPYTVRAVLQLAANDMSNIAGRVAPGSLHFPSIADVASLSRNLHGRGGLPINPATAEAVVNRAIAQGLLTPVDTVPTLQARLMDSQIGRAAYASPICVAKTPSNSRP